METGMYRILITAAMMGMTLVSSGQKSRVVSVLQMIESEKYEEAKEAIELAVENKGSANWPRTYYTKGLLCQTAFEAGFEKNDPKKTNLYDNQLLVAYSSYERALELDSRNRLGALIAKQYYALANDFQKLGRRYYGGREYARAFSAFEQALMLTRNPLLSIEPDSNLIYNTAMAAFEDRQWEHAIQYLTGLNEGGYSSNTALLLFRALMNSGDSLQAELVLRESLEKYDYNETLVLQLVDMLAADARLDSAVGILDSAATRWPGNHRFPWTRGLLLQRMGEHAQAVESLIVACQIAPDEVRIYYDLGICFYNQGVEINEMARNLQDNSEYQEARNMAMAQFQEAVTWLERAFELEPGDQQTISKLYQLYYRLQMTDKQKRLEPLIR